MKSKFYLKLMALFSFFLRCVGLGKNSWLFKGPAAVFISVCMNMNISCRYDVKNDNIQHI